MKTMKVLFLLLLAAGLHANPNSVAPYAGSNLDGFAKIRVSEPFTLFNSKQTSQQETVYWTTSTGGTGAAVVYDSNFVSNTLSAGTQSQGFASMQTRTYWPYSPGKSQLVYLTGNFMGAVALTTKRIGYFDDNNGIFIQTSGTALSCVIRSNTSGSVVDTNYALSTFEDPLDGTGPSKFTIDLTKSQIWIIDFEWLGVGTVRFGIWGNNKPIYFKTVGNNNSIIGPYMKNANLPVRYEIRNTAAVGTSANMSLICAAVISEGGSGNYLQGSAATPLAGTAFSAAQELPLIAIRIKSSFARGANVRPHGFSVGSTTSANGVAYVCYNCQISGGTWVSITNSAVEYNNSATLVVRTNTAAVIQNWTFSTAGARSSPDISVDPFLWANFDYAQTTQDTFVLGVYNLAGNNTYLGNLDFEEIR